MRKSKKLIKPQTAALIFLSFTFYFWLLTKSFYPFLQNSITVQPNVYWFITGYLLFVPLFAAAIILCRREGFKGLKEIIPGLNVKRLSKKDFVIASLSTLSVFVLTGLIMFVSKALHNQFGLRELQTAPEFMAFQPFVGMEKLLLLIWLPMWFFNIVGEELLWRGYIQSRLTAKYSWLLISILWLIFHLPFGFDLVIILSPIAVILPYVVHKTQNTSVGIFIHGLYNGPIFILIALGLI